MKLKKLTQMHRELQKLWHGMTPRSHALRRMAREAERRVSAILMGTKQTKLSLAPSATTDTLRTSFQPGMTGTE